MAPELPLPPTEVGFKAIGFFEDDVVLFPTDQTFSQGHASRPLVLSGKKWVPLAVPEFVFVKPKKNASGRYPPQGVARTADRDVLLWDGGGYVRQGKKLVRAFEIGEWNAFYELTSVPDGNGFFLCSNGKLVEVRPDVAPVPRLTNAKVWRVLSVRPGLDGIVFVGASRYSSDDPVFLLWWPARREYAPVSGKLYGLRPKQDFGQQHGVAPASRLAWGYEDIHHEFRALAWESLAALPRKAE